MKKIQGTFLSGYITISVTGDVPERFFDHCVTKGIIIWNAKKISTSTCEGNIKLRDVPLAKKISEQFNYKISFTQEKGLPLLFKLFLRRKELLTAFVICIMFILFLSNIIWSVEVKGVSTEIEEKINEQLHEYGIQPGSWAFTLESPSSIQQSLTNDIPELLWVGVKRKGTTYQLEGVEKIIVKRDESPGPRHLIASKSAVIQKMYVKQGRSKVKVNDFVKKGDMLVSGIMSQKEIDETENNISENDVTYIAADAEITGKTWYEIEVEIPLEGKSDSLTGNFEHSNFLRIGQVKLPYSGFNKPNYNQEFRETKENELYFLSWKLPIAIGKTIFREKVYNKINRTKEEAIAIGITQAKKELKLELGPQIKILSEKVLHETLDSGKVNLNLFITVEEDIVVSDPITQGD